VYPTASDSDLAESPGLIPGGLAQALGPAIIVWIARSARRPKEQGLRQPAKLVSRRRATRLLNGKAALSGDMALRIEKASGVRMDTLMRMQSSYDIAQTRKREKQIHVQRIHHFADAHA